MSDSTKTVRNLKFTIAYDGTDFYGWQIQNHETRTVQGVIQQNLQKILRHPVTLVGSGRTDTGVHARGQVAHIFTSSPIPTINLMNVVNRALPADIIIHQIEEVSFDFHARYSILTKTYRYFLYQEASRDPFDGRFAWMIPHPLNFQKMNDAARCFVGTHNFLGFQSSSRGNNKLDPIRSIHNLEITKTNNQFCVTITANGFLYKMVRNIVSAIILVGNDEWSSYDIQNLLLHPSRENDLKPAPAQGLFLWNAHY
jgi:tRNA pseudouridine38-40 synthase